MPIKMNPEAKAEWIKRLLSGEYKKGKYDLRDVEDHYSPAGILCEIAVDEGIIEPPVGYLDKVEGRVFYGYVYESADKRERMATGLPSTVVEWAQLPYRAAYSLDMKCDKGWSFAKVAEYIEKEF